MAIETIIGSDTRAGINYTAPKDQGSGGETNLARFISQIDSLMPSKDEVFGDTDKTKQRAELLRWKRYLDPEKRAVIDKELTESQKERDDVNEQLELAEADGAELAPFNEAKVKADRRLTEAQRAVPEVLRTGTSTTTTPEKQKTPYEQLVDRLLVVAGDDKIDRTPLISQIDSLMPSKDEVFGDTDKTKQRAELLRWKRYLDPEKRAVIDKELTESQKERDDVNEQLELAEADGAELAPFNEAKVKADRRLTEAQRAVPEVLRTGTSTVKGSEKAENPYEELVDRLVTLVQRGTTTSVSPAVQAAPAEVSIPAEAGGKVREITPDQIKAEVEKIETMTVGELGEYLRKEEAILLAKMEDGSLVWLEAYSRYLDLGGKPIPDSDFLKGLVKDDKRDDLLKRKKAGEDILIKTPGQSVEATQGATTPDYSKAKSFFRDPAKATNENAKAVDEALKRIISGKQTPDDINLMMLLDWNKFTPEFRKLVSSLYAQQLSKAEDKTEPVGQPAGAEGPTREKTEPKGFGARARLKAFFNAGKPQEGRAKTGATPEQAVIETPRKRGIKEILGGVATELDKTGNSLQVLSPEEFMDLIFRTMKGVVGDIPAYEKMEISLRNINLMGEGDKILILGEMPDRAGKLIKVRFEIDKDIVFTPWYASADGKSTGIRVGPEVSFLQRINGVIRDDLGVEEAIGKMEIKYKEHEDGKIISLVFLK